jgi:hypothetical protein
MEAAHIPWKHRLLAALPERLQIVLSASWGYRTRLGHWPHLMRPRNFAEQVQRSKICDRDSRLPLFADKLCVKDYVRDKLGAAWLIPTLWSGKVLPPLAERNWPMPFVIKVNSGCGWNIFVRATTDCDWPAIEATCGRWMKTIYGMTRGEWLYRRIDPQILIEPLICPDQPHPLDYKFWTFHGRVECIYVVTDRHRDMKVTFFSRDWQRLPVKINNPVDTRDIPPPASLQAMIAAAETLADDLPFVRVDFYEVDGRPLFGEMTFYPASGYDYLEPPEFGRHLLRLWQGCA